MQLLEFRRKESNGLEAWLALRDLQWIFESLRERYLLVYTLLPIMFANHPAIEDVRGHVLQGLQLSHSKCGVSCYLKLPMQE